MYWTSSGRQNSSNVNQLYWPILWQLLLGPVSANLYLSRIKSIVASPWYVWTGPVLAAGRLSQYLLQLWPSNGNSYWPSIVPDCTRPIQIVITGPSWATVIGPKKQTNKQTNTETPKPRVGVRFFACAFQKTLVHGASTYTKSPALLRVLNTCTCASSSKHLHICKQHLRVCVSSFQALASSQWYLKTLVLTHIRLRRT